MDERTAEFWIDWLKLERHPEGGYYRRAYQSEEYVPEECLPERFSGSRLLSTSIHYLLKRECVSRLHRIRSDELWHFYAGGSTVVHVLSQDGVRTNLLLGPDPRQGHRFQAVVPHGSWFAAEVIDGPYALFGCTVSPGFEFEDLELAERSRLTALYPRHRSLIERFT